MVHNLWNAKFVLVFTIFSFSGYNAHRVLLSTDLAVEDKKIMSQVAYSPSNCSELQSLAYSAVESGGSGNHIAMRDAIAQAALHDCLDVPTKSSLLTKILTWVDHNRKNEIIIIELMAAFVLKWNGNAFHDNLLSAADYCWLTTHSYVKFLFESSKRKNLLWRYLSNKRNIVPNLFVPGGDKQRQCLGELLLLRRTCTSSCFEGMQILVRAAQAQALQEKPQLSEAEMVFDVMMPTWEKKKEKSPVQFVHALTQVATYAPLPDVLISRLTLWAAYIETTPSTLFTVLGYWEDPHSDTYGIDLWRNIRDPTIENTELQSYDFALAIAANWRCGAVSHKYACGPKWLEDLKGINSVTECTDGEYFAQHDNDCRFHLRAFFAQLSVFVKFVGAPTASDDKDMRAELVDFFVIPTLSNINKAADRVFTSKITVESFDSFLDISDALEFSRSLGELGDAKEPELRLDAIREVLNLESPVRLPSLCNAGKLTPLISLLPQLIVPLLKANSQIEDESDPKDASLLRLQWLASQLKRGTLRVLRQMLGSLARLELPESTIGMLFEMLPAIRTTFQIKLQNLEVEGLPKELQLKKVHKTVIVTDDQRHEKLLKPGDELRSVKIIPDSSDGQRILSNKQMKNLDPTTFFTSSEARGMLVLEFKRKVAQQQLSVTNWAGNLVLFAAIHSPIEASVGSELALPDREDDKGALRKGLKSFSSLVPGPHTVLSYLTSGEWVAGEFSKVFPTVTKSAVTCVAAKFRRPDLLLRYAKGKEDHLLDIWALWINALGEDCLEPRPQGQGALDKLRFEHPRNREHLQHVPNETLAAWIASNEIERDPETLFHIGEAVDSCQAITGFFAASYGRALVSYLVVGHFGVLTDIDGPDACANMPEAPTCNLLRGRAVVRLLLDSGGSPALLLEPLYKTKRVSGESNVKALRERLLQKAIRLSIETKASLYAVDDWSDVAPDIGQIHKLTSYGGLAPYAYLDSGDGFLGSNDNQGCKFTVKPDLRIA